MEKLRTPLQVNAIYTLLLGLSALSPSVVRVVFGYEVKDAGVLLVLSAVFLGFGVVLWSIAGDPEEYGGLAMPVIISIVIGIVFVLWGWVNHLFTARNVVLPLIIDIVLVGWIWSARPKS